MGETGSLQMSDSKRSKSFSAAVRTRYMINSMRYMGTWYYMKQGSGLFRPGDQLVKNDGKQPNVLTTVMTGRTTGSHGSRPPH